MVAAGVSVFSCFAFKLFLLVVNWFLLFLMAPTPPHPTPNAPSWNLLLCFVLFGVEGWEGGEHLAPGELKPTRVLGAPHPG